MAEKKKFPEAIKQQGLGEKREFLFLSEERKDGKKIYVLMRADKNSVSKLEKPAKVGEKLPVYVQLMSRYIFTGELGMA